MKLKLTSLLLGAGLLALPGLLQAQPTAHYTPGVEGIKGASLPPPGTYFRDYNVCYYADGLNDPIGNEFTGLDPKVFIYANVPRIIWITDTQFLGGNVGLDALLPLLYKSVAINTPAGRYDHDTFGIGDLFAEATLSWHPKQFDFAIGSGIWMPTGDSGSMTRAGLGYWTPMLTAGATWYIDQDKTWAVSALNRYEFNTEQRDMHYTPGQAYTMEWGVSKTLNKTIDVGAVGYYQQKVTSDSDTPAAYRDRVAAVGPEVSVVFPKSMFFVSFRYLYEFMAEDRLQGHTFALTLTKKL
jgi:hypothetical protein